MAQVLGYGPRQLTDTERSDRWGVYNYDADRFLDAHFGSEAEARRAAVFLTKTRVR